MNNGFLSQRNQSNTKSFFDGFYDSVKEGATSLLNVINNPSKASKAIVANMEGNLDRLANPQRSQLQ